jgi:hypothetical protein
MNENVSERRKKMAKIYRYRTSQNNCVQALKDLLARAERGEMTGFVFAASLPDGNVATSWANTDVGERQYLLAHMQSDITMAIIEANADRVAGMVSEYLD